jgi:hypothetical protein
MNINITVIAVLLVHRAMINKCKSNDELLYSIVNKEMHSKVMFLLMATS